MRSKKRVLIFSASFGGGHRSAAEALAAYLRQHHAQEVDVRIVDFFEQFLPGVNTLAKFAYQQSVTFFPELYGTFFDLSNKLPSNPVVHELRLMGFARASSYIDEYRPDAVISTFPVAGGVVSDLKADRPVVAATVITDYGVHRTWIHPATDLYFLASDEVERDLTDRGIASEHLVVSGIPVAEKFSERLSREECRTELGLDHTFTVLLTNAAGLTSEVRDIAKSIGQSGIQVLSATGHNSRLKRRLDSVARNCERVHPMGYTTQMNRFMAASDVLVGKAGGLTVSEALAMGLPAIIHNPVPGQEIYNVDYLVNAGAGFLSRDEDDVVEKVRYLARHPQRLAQMSANASALGRPEAARTICARVLESL